MRGAFFGSDATLSGIAAAFFAIGAAFSAMHAAFFAIDATFFAIDATFFGARAAFFATRLARCDAMRLAVMASPLPVGQRWIQSASGIGRRGHASGLGNWIAARFLPRMSSRHSVERRPKRKQAARGRPVCVSKESLCGTRYTANSHWTSPQRANFRFFWWLWNHAACNCTSQHGNRWKSTLHISYQQRSRG